MNDSNEIACHKKKLGHRGDVQHLRVNSDWDAGSGTECAEGQETQLRRAIYDHDVVCSGNRLDG